MTYIKRVRHGEMLRTELVDDLAETALQILQPYWYKFQHPSLTYVKPFDCPEAYQIYIQRAIDRGNRPEWAESIMSYIGQDPEAFYDATQLSHLSLLKVPPQWYLSDVINAGLI